MGRIFDTKLWENGLLFWNFDTTFDTDFMKTGYIYKGICLTCFMGKSLKNEEWYVDGKAPLSLGYDAIRLRINRMKCGPIVFGQLVLFWWIAVSMRTEKIWDIFILRDTDRLCGM